MSTFRKLPLAFYDRPATVVAMQLLGQRLVHKRHSRIITGYIVEAEAYLGLDDPACHSFGHRQTRRTASMYLPGGHAYVYFIYGMYFCFNVVTGDTTKPEAVLIRAVLPDISLNITFKQTNGPGKLCREFQINQKLDGEPLTGDRLFITEGWPPARPNAIRNSSRIGISKSNPAADWPLRFFLDQYVKK